MWTVECFSTCQGLKGVYMMFTCVTDRICNRCFGFNATDRKDNRSELRFGYRLLTVTATTAITNTVPLSLSYVTVWATCHCKRFYYVTVPANCHCRSNQSAFICVSLFVFAKNHCPSGVEVQQCIPESRSSCFSSLYHLPLRLIGSLLCGTVSFLSIHYSSL